MNYYDLHINQKQLSQGLVANYSNDQWIPLIEGSKISNKFDVPIQYKLHRTGHAKTFYPAKQDFLHIGGGGILIHNRAKELFASLTKHHTMYKSEIEYKGEKLPEAYYTMNLETLRPAMEMEKSIFRMDEIRGKKYIASVHKLVLSQKKLDEIPKDEHLFRLKEYTPITIVDEYGKNLIEEAKIVGVEFSELEVV